jgi:membrane-bound serine protease (ClpP class)
MGRHAKSDEGVISVMGGFRRFKKSNNSKDSKSSVRARFLRVATFLGLTSFILFSMVFSNHIQNVHAEPVDVPKDLKTQSASSASSSSTVSSASSGRSTVIHMEIEGSINPAGLDYLKSGIALAESKKASLIVIRLDTPGGLLNTTRSIVQEISKSKVPVAFWVSPAGASATSAGAIISIGSHLIFMSPGTNIGAAHPVGPQGKDIDGAMKDKAVNDTVAFVKSMAKLRGRNEALAAKIVSKSESLTPEKALKEKLIDGVVDDLSGLFKSANGKKVKVGEGKEVEIAISENPEVIKLDMTMGQSFLHLVSNPNIAYILMMLGGLGIYVEITNPGALIPGIIGAVCILLAFISLQTLPINTGAIGLIVLGIGMLIAEPFVPSFGALTIGGLAALVIGSLFLIDTSASDLSVSLPLIVGVVGGIGVIVIFIAKSVVAAFRRPKNDGYGVEQKVGEVFELDSEAVHHEGIKSSGRLKIRGEIWQFESEDVLNEKDEVTVISEKGLVLKVKK